MNRDKVEMIESINNIVDLQNLIINILEKSEIREIKTVDDFLYFTIQNVLGNQDVLVFTTIDYLGKKFENFDLITDQISKKLKAKTYNSIYVISNKNITEGFKQKLNKAFQNFKFDYWDKSKLVEKVDDSYSDYWRHDDPQLIKFEKHFEENVNDDWSIKKVKQFKNAHEKLLEIFVTPRLSHKVNDFESSNKALVKIGIDKLIEQKSPVILEGEPGVGKTRLLKQIGLEFINNNTQKSGSRHLPIFINNIDLIESRIAVTDLINIRRAIERKLNTHFINKTLEEIGEDYSLVFLIDSIDEFDKENQTKLLSDLKGFCSEKTHIYLGTRFQDYSAINGINEIGKCEEVYVEKFNDHQIKRFLSSYFKNDMIKADDLLQSLKENSIIQRLPITPLNLSLISILYEENNFEIPATITDIYDNFNNLLLGRTLPDSKFDFFDINFRERILSVYALELLQRGERNYMTQEEFHHFFVDFFTPIKGTVKLELLPEALDFLIYNTGILMLQDNKYVKFLHESYMEYYASREIFNYHRTTLEPKLVENFLEVSWQYTAIFYAGRSKQMDDFLIKLIDRTKRSHKTVEFYKSIHGLGYICQALYMSDDKLRKDAVLTSLNFILEIYEWMKKFSSDDKLFFKNLSIPVTAVINSMFFFENYNSITLRGPLELAFDELLPKLESKAAANDKPFIDSNIAYKLFTIALTLSSPRIGNLDKIKELIYNTSILNDPLFEKLLDFGLSVAGSKELYELKEDFKKPNRTKKSTNKVIKFNSNAEDLYLTAPIGRLRFSVYDRIYPDRKFVLITEGKTDAQIIEHAFMILTDCNPYWEITPIHESQGGARELAKCLENGAKLSEGKKIIGIFDNDDAGISEFKGGLKDSKFEYYNGSTRIKKNKEANIFGLKLPIPPFREKYFQTDQKFNFFSIEHYFDDDLLNDNNMLLETPMPEIFKISDKGTKKADFSKTVRALDSKKIFKNFVYLFMEIDSIFEIHDIEYKTEE